MSGKIPVGQKVTHRREELKENQKKVRSEDHQEVHGRISSDFVEKARYTASTCATPEFHRPHDNKESRGILTKEWLAPEPRAGTRTYHIRLKARYL